MLETFADFATGHHRIGNVHNRALRNGEVMEYHLAIGKRANKKIGNTDVGTKSGMHSHVAHFT